MDARKLVVGETDVVLTPRVPPARTEQLLLNYLHRDRVRGSSLLSWLQNTSPVLSVGRSLCLPEPHMKTSRSVSKSKELMPMEELADKPRPLSLWEVAL